jgi:hypothetical protein
MLFNGVPGVWSSSSDKALSLSRRHGVAVAREPGQVTVTYGDPVNHDLRTQVVVNVLPAAKVELLVPPEVGGEFSNLLRF